MSGSSSPAYAWNSRESSRPSSAASSRSAADTLPSRPASAQSNQSHTIRQPFTSEHTKKPPTFKPAPQTQPFETRSHASLATSSLSFLSHTDRTSSSLSHHHQLASLNEFHSKEKKSLQRTIDALQSQLSQTKSINNDSRRVKKINDLERQLQESQTQLRLMNEYIERRGWMSLAEMATMMDTLAQQANVVDPVNLPRMKHELHEAKRQRSDLQFVVEKLKMKVREQREQLKEMKQSSHHKPSEEEKEPIPDFHADRNDGDGDDGDRERTARNGVLPSLSTASNTAHTETINQLQSELAALTQQLYQRDSEVNELQSSLQSSQSQLQSLLHQHALELKERERHYRSMLVKHSNDSSATKQRDDELLYQELRQLQTEIKMIISEKDELMNQLLASQTNESVIETELQSLQAVVHRMTSMPDAIENERLSTMLEEQNKIIAVLTADPKAGNDWLLQSANDRISELELELQHYDSCRADNDKLHQQLTDATDRLRASENHSKDLSSDIQQQQLSRTGLETDLQSLQADNAQLRSELARLSLINQSLSAELAEVKCAIVDIEEEKLELAMHRRELAEEREHQVQQEKQFVNELEYGRRSQSAADEQRKKYDSEIERLNRRLKANEGERKTFLLAIDNLNSSVRELNHKLKVNESSSGASGEVLAAMRQQLAALNDQHAQELSSIETRIRDELKSDSDRTDSIIRDKEELIRLLQRENYDVSMRVDSQARKIVELAEEIGALNDKLVQISGTTNSEGSGSCQQSSRATEPNGSSVVNWSPRQTPSTASPRFNHVPATVSPRHAVTTEAASNEVNTTVEVAAEIASVKLAAPEQASSHSQSQLAEPVTAQQPSTPRAPATGEAETDAQMDTTPFASPLPLRHTPSRSNKSSLTIPTVPPSPFVTTECVAGRTRISVSTYPEDRNEFVALALNADALLDRELSTEVDERQQQQPVSEQ